MTDATFEVRLKGDTDERPKQFGSLSDALRHARAQVQNREIDRAEIWVLEGPNGPDLVRVLHRAASWVETVAENGRDLKNAIRRGEGILGFLKRRVWKR
jgi:hypothetical protein